MLLLTVLVAAVQRWLIGPVSIFLPRLLAMVLRLIVPAAIHALLLMLYMYIDPHLERSLIIEEQPILKQTHFQKDLTMIN